MIFWTLTKHKIRTNIKFSIFPKKVYNAEYFGHKIHYDRDGFSGRRIGHATVARKSNVVIYEEIYRLTITFFHLQEWCISDFSKILLYQIFYIL